MPIIHNDLTMICDYCQTTGRLNAGQDKRLGSKWYVVCRAEMVDDRLRDSFSGDEIVFCIKCKSYIDEICRIHRCEENKLLNPPDLPTPDDLLPEEDLPDSAFINGYPNPEVACIGGGFHLDENLDTSMLLKLKGLKRKNKDK